MQLYRLSPRRLIKVLASMVLAGSASLAMLDASAVTPVVVPTFTPALALPVAPVPAGFDITGFIQEATLDTTGAICNAKHVRLAGGTVTLKYLSIWNAGADSFDVDQGWRGKA